MTLSGTGSFGGPVSGDWHAVVDVLEILDEAVTIRDRHGRIAYGNRAALESMGLASIDELRSRSSRSIMEDYIVEDERGAPLTLEDVPSIRMMQGQPVQPLVMRTTHRDTGEVRWRQLKAAPVTDDKGELIAAVTVIEDVTAVKTAETRMRLLAESGRIARFVARLPADAPERRECRRAGPGGLVRGGPGRREQYTNQPVIFF